MPVVVTGLKQTMKSLRSIQPDLEKNLRSQIKAATEPVIRTAQVLVPQTIGGLSSWTRTGKKEAGGTFPAFNRSVVSRGIKTQIGGRKANSNGFASIVRIANTSRSGAIYEWAGRTSTNGQPWVGRKDFNNHKVSHSRNPNAGIWFIDHLPDLVGQKHLRGRLIYKAWNEDHGRVQSAVAKIAQASVAQSMESNS